MTIARGQMNRQLYQDGSRGIKDLMEDKISDDEIRNIISVLEDVDIIDEDVMSDEDMEVMEMNRIRQSGPNYQYDENNMYEGPKDMRMGGGIMSVNREKFGIGSKLKRAFKKVSKIADPVIQAAAVIPNPYQPFAQAYTAGRSLGIGGDYRGLQLGPYTPGAYGGKYGLNPLEGFGGKYGITRTSEGLNIFNKPIEGSEFFKLASDTPSAFAKSLDPVEYDALYKAGDFDVVKNIPKKDLFSLERVTDYLSGKLAEVSLADIAKVTFLGKMYFDSREDQERLNKLAEEAYKKYTAAKEKKREQYGVGEGEGITVLNPTRTKEEVVQAARGGIINSRKGYMMGSEVPIRENQAGVSEMDFRETGGFVPPVGIKEKADDIPAMLSNNEFVFTADAVRAAGGGSVNKGAQKMYALMKKLEGQA